MSQKVKATKAPFDPSQGRKTKKVPLTQVARMVSQRIGKRKADENFDYQSVLKFAWVPAEKVYINYERQRWPEPVHIEKLGKKWNIVCVTPLQCRYDPNEDVYYGADGQQHSIEWVRQYGDQSMVPVFYVESTDENIESIQLLALNTDNEPMAKYFIHQQKVVMGDPDAVELENTVLAADCQTAYKKRTPGAITHISDLQMAQGEYGLDDLFIVLSKYRQYWPGEVIKTATMLGFLKVKEIMDANGTFTDERFDDVFASAADYFENADRLHLDIKEEFAITYPTNYKGMGVREKVASGIMNVFHQKNNIVLGEEPFAIKMPMMNQAA